MGKYHSFYTGKHQICQLLIVFEIEHMSHIFKLASATGERVNKSLTFPEWPRKFWKCVPEPRKPRQSIGNGKQS